MKQKHFEKFALGALVIPARDGMLKALGFDVSALGQKALGLVIDPRKGKSFVAFPELSLQVWLEHNELADLHFEAGRGEKAYQDLLPNFAQGDLPMVYWVHRAIHKLNAQYVLSMEKAAWADVWDDHASRLVSYTLDAPPERIEKFSVGIEELLMPSWKTFCEELGSRLFVTRILPAGLHKIDVSFYLRPSGW